MSSVYHLPKVDLVVRQSNQEDGGVAITALQSNYTEMLNDKNLQIARLQEQLSSIRMADTLAVGGMTRELGIFVPQINDMSLSRHVSYNKDGVPTDTTYICFLSFREDSVANLELIRNWLSNRTGTSNIKILLKE